MFMLNKKVHLVFLVVTLLFSIVNVQAKDFPDFTGLVEKHSAAVVNISTKQKVQRSSRNLRLPKELTDRLFPNDPSRPSDPIEDLLKHFFQEPNVPYSDDESQANSLGSGFIISKDGYILTNAHVIDQADEIMVRLIDRREYKATVVGTDKKSDTALLKIDTHEDLPVVNIGSAEKLKVGEWVLAIGSPFGFDYSVTAGIVSAKGRNLPRENYVPFIQTDVAINPGNSGGPLFNLDGEVVGMNSQIFSGTGGFMGLSFAIPIEMSMNVVKQLKEHGHVTRGWLGVVIQDLTRQLADSFGMKHPKGALVSKVLKDSPAHKAGIQIGDVIIKFNGHDVLTSTQLPPLVGASRIDKLASVTVIRAGKEKIIQVNIGELDEQYLSNKSTDKMPNIASTTNVLKILVAELQDVRKSKLKTQYGGVVVTRIMSGPAKKAGIQKGDVIQMLNNQRIESVRDFNRVVNRLPKSKTIAVLLIRQDDPQFLAIRLP